MDSRNILSTGASTETLQLKSRTKLGWLVDLVIVFAFILTLAGCFISWFLVSIAGNMTASGVVVIGILSCIVGLFLWKTHARLWWIRTIYVCLLLIRGLSASLELAPRNLNAAILVAAVAVAAVAVVIGVFRQKGARQVALAMLFPIEFLVAAAWVQVQPSSSSLAQAIEFGGLSLGLPFLIPIGLYWWGSLIADERHLGPGSELQMSFWVTWLSLVLAFLAIMTASLSLIVASGAGAPDVPTSDRYMRYQVIMLIGLATATGLCLLGRLRNKPAEEPVLPRWPEEPRLGVNNLSALLVAAGAIAWGVAPWAATFWVDGSLGSLDLVPFRVVFYIIGTLNGIWLGIAAINDIHGNLALEEFYRFSRKTWLVSITCGSAIASNWIWLWLVGIWVHGGWAPLVSLAEVIGIVYFGGSAFLVVGSWAIVRATPRPRNEPAYHYLSLEHPIQLVFNDHILQGFSALATLFAVFIGDQVSESVHATVGGNITWLGTILIVAPTILVLVPLFFVVRTNTDKNFAWEDNHISASILARADGDRKLAEDLSKQRMRRLRRRADFLFLLTFLLSPIGLLVLLWQAIQWALGPTNADQESQGV